MFLAHLSDCVHLVKSATIGMFPKPISAEFSKEQVLDLWSGVMICLHYNSHGAQSGGGPLRLELDLRRIALSWFFAVTVLENWVVKSFLPNSWVLIFHWGIMEISAKQLPSS